MSIFKHFPKRNTLGVSAYTWRRIQKYMNLVGFRKRHFSHDDVSVRGGFSVRLCYLPSGSELALRVRTPTLCRHLTTDNPGAADCIETRSKRASPEDMRQFRRILDKIFSSGEGASYREQTPFGEKHCGHEERHAVPPLGRVEDSNWRLSVSFGKVHHWTVDGYWEDSERGRTVRQTRCGGERFGTKP